MADWWDGLPQERFWCEVTDRRDIGADLKCPQTDEEGHAYWSYSLIHSVVPGDVVFTIPRVRRRSLVRRSPVDRLQSALLSGRRTVVGRKKHESRAARPGWWRPLYGFVPASDPLTLHQSK
jgi:hypothetical protein